MTAIDAYARYLRHRIGAEPEMVTRDGKVTVTAKNQRSVLTVTFRAAASGWKHEDWQPASIRVTRGNGAVRGYATGQLSRAVADLLSDHVPAGTPALERNGT